MPSARPGAAAVSVGASLPAGVLLNAEIEARLELAPDWIFRRTGIQSRRQASPDERLQTHATAAARQALERAGVAAEEVELVIVATTTADEIMPGAAPLVAHDLGATRAGAFDLSAACTGFLSALSVGSAQIESGRVEHRGDRWRRPDVTDHRSDGPLNRRRIRRRRRRGRVAGDRHRQPDRSGDPRRRRRGRRSHPGRPRGRHDPDARARDLPGGGREAVALHRTGDPRRRRRAGRDRPVRLSPGQRPDPDGSRRAPRPRPREGRRLHRGAGEHDRGDAAAGARPCAARRPAGAGRQGAARRVRRRVHLGRDRG